MELFFAFVYASGSLICHQLPERSFFLDGRQLPVCARCTGLYLSGAAGFLAWLIWKAARGWRRIATPRRKVRVVGTPVVVPPRVALAIVIVAGVPTALSYATGVTGVWDGSNLTRALLAVPLGASAGAVVAAVATKDLR
jgi:hypothetical protein